MITMKEEDRGPLDITLLLEQANKKIEDLKDVIDGHKSWHDSDKQQIFDLKQALGKLQNLDILNTQHKMLIAQLKRDHTLLAKQFDEQLNQFRNKGSL